MMRICTCVMLLLLTATTFVQAEGIFIAAPDRKDMVYDDTREIIYISNGAEVLRYDINAGDFLSPFVLGGDLLGMDLSPDGNFLAVADTVESAATNHVHIIDLVTETLERVEFSLDRMEGGTWTVAYGIDGQLLITSMFNGSGWVPMRRYDPATGTVVPLSSVRQNSMVVASGDAAKIVYVESNISSGPVGSYDVATQSFLGETSTGWFAFEVGSNMDGTHISVPTYGGTFLFDDAWNDLDTIGVYAGGQPIGVVYHPVEDLVYYPWADTRLVHVYDTTTNTPVNTFDFENDFVHVNNWAFRAGRSKISRDGSLLMVSVNGGVRYLRMYDALSAQDVTASVEKNVAASITMDGAVGNGGSIRYEITIAPAHGTLTGSGATVQYTPDHDVIGSDQFTYTTVYGRARSTAIVNISITNTAPVATPQSVTVDEDTVGNPIILAGSDRNGDALTYTVTGGPANGTLNGTAPNLTYTPDPDYFGADTFTFNVNDGSAGSPDVTVTITINDVAETSSVPVSAEKGSSSGGCFISTSLR